MPVLIAAGLVCGGAGTALAINPSALSISFGAASLAVDGSTTLVFQIINTNVAFSLN